MRNAVPDDCFLTLPAEITPELARTFPEKINLLLQTQLLGRSIADLDSALRLVMDLAGELVRFDKAAVLWSDEPDGTLQLHSGRGFDGPVPVVQLRQLLAADKTPTRPRPLLANPARCDHPAVHELLAKTEANSLISVPMYLDEQVQGALQLFREHGEPFSHDEAHLLRVFSLSFEGVLENLQHAARPKAYAFLDRLTGLFNRRYFEQQLERELDRARRHNEAASTLLVEVEGLGQVRAAHGHLAAEAALQEVARGLVRVCRKSDTLSRYHGDQFAVLLPRTGKTDMALVAQRVFGALAGPFLSSLPNAADVNLSFSLGAATYPEDAFSPSSMLEICEDGLGKARLQHHTRRFHQPASTSPGTEKEDLLDPARMGLLTEPLLQPSHLLQLFARICLDAVPADRVSIMVREGDELVIQVAYGFDSQDEVTRVRRVRLDQHNISSWVAQRKKPLLVSGSDTPEELPVLGTDAYTSDSFFSYPLLLNDDLLGVVHFSNPSDGTHFTQEQVDGFESLAAVISGYLSRDRQFGEAQEEFLREALFSLVDVMEGQVPGMARHSQEVAKLAEATARRLGFSPQDLERLEVSARLHDLGKVSYRTNILAADRALSPRERAVTQRHPLLGWKVLEEVPLRCVDRDAILYHHEREDGSGYLHKAANEVPDAAKVLAVADVYQALTSHRAYRPAVSPQEARSYLAGHKGSLFDGRVVDALLETLPPDRPST